MATGGCMQCCPAKGCVVLCVRCNACGGVRVRSGDLVLGDEDGVVVVPVGIGGAALAAAEEKLGLERAAKTLLEHGETATAMYEQHGIL